MNSLTMCETYEYVSRYFIHVVQLSGEQIEYFNTVIFRVIIQIYSFDIFNLIIIIILDMNFI